MSSIGKVGANNWRYYQNSVAAGLEDSYAGDGESPGRWMGRADLLGATLGADVTEAEASLLMAAQVAPDGTRLGRAPSARSVNAFDATFSAPKSVSVLYALGDPGITLAVTQAQDAAVAAELEYLDAHASHTRVDRGGHAVVDSDGLAAVAYRHRTSRALDPQLHDHVLVVNAVRAEHDGRWRTIDGRQLYRHAKAAGTVYQGALRSELMARLEVRFEPVSEHGQADIVGIDPELIDEDAVDAPDRRRRQRPATGTARGEQTAVERVEVGRLQFRQPLRAERRHQRTVDVAARLLGGLRREVRRRELEPGVEQLAHRRCRAHLARLP